MRNQKVVPISTYSSHLITSFVVLITLFLKASIASENPVISHPKKSTIETVAQSVNPSVDLVTPVDQLQDVSPTDWAFSALKNLAERYGCLTGYPDYTFRGNQAMTRFEFAAGLNFCLQQLEPLMAAATVDRVSEDDLEVLQKLTQMFEAELTALETQINLLENQVIALEAHQFSTTTKLRGEVAFALTGAFGDEKANDSDADVEENIIFDHRVRLFFNTSFTGKDRLLLRLDATNLTQMGTGVTGTNMTRLAFDRATNNELVIGRLFYRFPVNSKLRFTIDATEGRFDTAVSNTFNPFFASSFNGAISNFGRFNPIYIQGRRGTGITAVYRLSDAFNLSLGYMARNAADARDDNGLFNGSYAALAQLEVQPTDSLSLGLTYVRAYYPETQISVSGSTGSRLANAPFGQVATAANHLGLESSWRASSQVALSGWAGLTFAQAQADGTGFAGFQ
jgi:hypothetical protein